MWGGEPGVHSAWLLGPFDLQVFLAGCNSQIGKGKGCQAALTKSPGCSRRRVCKR